VDKVAEQLQGMLTEGEAILEKQAFEASITALENGLPEDQQEKLAGIFNELHKMFGEQYSPNALLKVAEDLLNEQQAQEEDPEFKKQAELSYQLGELAAEALVEKLRS